MFGILPAFENSSDSADSDIRSASSEDIDGSDSEDSTDDHHTSQTKSKLAKVEATCPFKCTKDGFVVCVYCRKAVINPEACKKHINKYHKTASTWLRPISEDESANAMSVLQMQQLYASHEEHRPPFEGILIQEGFKCTGCNNTYISAQTSRRHLSDCRGKNANAVLIPVKCQQPLSWNNPRTGVSFQRVFEVTPDGHQISFPHDIWEQSQSDVATDTPIIRNRLNLLLNWHHLHCDIFPNVPYSVFQKLCASSGEEKWLPKIQKCADEYFALLKQVIIDVEDAGDQRSLCKIRMNSEKDALPCRGFYWLNEGSIAKYKCCSVRIVAFICR